MDIKPGDDNAAVFHLKRAGQVRVLTIDAASTLSELAPVPNIPIEIRGTREHFFYKTTHTDVTGYGIFDSVPIDVQLQVQAIQGHAYEVKKVSFKGDSILADIILKVKTNPPPPEDEPSGWVRGAIQDMDGHPISDCKVAVRHNKGTVVVFSDAAGNFFADGVQARRERLLITSAKETYTPATAETAINSSVTLTLSASVTMRCRVLDMITKEPVSSFTVKKSSSIPIVSTFGSSGNFKD